MQYSNLVQYIFNSKLKYPNFKSFLPKENTNNLHIQNMHTLCAESRERYIRRLVQEYKEKHKTPLSIKLGNEINRQLQNKSFNISYISIPVITVLSIPSILYFLEKWRE